MQLGDIMAKLAQGQSPLSLAEIDFLRLQLNQAQSVNAAVSGWLSGGAINLQNSNIFANKTVLNNVPINGTFFEGSVNMPSNGVDYEIAWSFDKFTKRYGEESALIPGSDFVYDATTTYKRTKFQDWSSGRHYILLFFFYIRDTAYPPTTLSGVTTQIKIKNYELSSGTLLGTGTLFNDSINGNVYQNIIYAIRNAADPPLEFTITAQHDKTAFSTMQIQMNAVSFLVL